MDRLAETIELGQKAQELINNPVYQNVFTALKNEYLEAWGSTTPIQSEEREHYWRMIHAITELENSIHTLVQGKLIAQTELEYINGEEND